MTDLPGWAPPGVDTQRANTARVYDYLLGGSHNFLADQDAGRAITALDPAARVFARANRAFLGRAVRFLAANGITQFLDIGSGIPTERNVHEVAREAAPGARVAYVDVDPVAIAHSKAILAGQPDTAVIEADLRDPEKVLASAEVGRVIDFSQPAGLLLVAVLHFIGSAGIRGGWSRRCGTRSPRAVISSWARPPARAAPPGTRRSRRCTTGAWRRRSTSAHGPGSSASSTASTWSTRAWCGCRCGGPTHRPTCLRTPAGPATWSAWPARTDAEWPHD